MKYIVLTIKQSNLDKKVPFIFPSFLVHAEVAAAMRQVLHRHGFEDAVATSAGEVGGLDMEYAAGESTTLKLKADEGDAKMMCMYDYLHGLS